MRLMIARTSGLPLEHCRLHCGQPELPRFHARQSKPESRRGTLHPAPLAATRTSEAGPALTIIVITIILLTQKLTHAVTAVASCLTLVREAV